MATEEYLLRCLEKGRRYEDLPPRFRQTLTEEEWRRKVKAFCIQRGFSWVASVARSVCPELEYYEDLVIFYRSKRRLFPYHLSEYICRVMRLSPFAYYIDMLTEVMMGDEAFDAIPNFTAADIVRVVGVGRNEFIAAMQGAKSKRLMWRLAQRGAARDCLPLDPKAPRPRPWWVVQLVNLTETEHRKLQQVELSVCEAVARPGGITLRELGERHKNHSLDVVVQELHRRGLVWFDVPINAQDHVRVPPLEGFVSNRSAKRGEEDALESLLYSALVAASDLATVERLAAVLGVDLPTLRVALSVACRLGFCEKVEDEVVVESEAKGLYDDGVAIDQAAESVENSDMKRTQHLAPSSSFLRLELAPGRQASSSSVASTSTFVGGGEPEAAAREPLGINRRTTSGDGQPNSSLVGSRKTTTTSSSIGTTSAGPLADARCVGIVVDSQVTGFLMMGALTPACKRHSVTLFEGGRISGATETAELARELAASAEAGREFEGEMRALSSYAFSLAALMRCVSGAAGPGHPLELIRKESLAALAPAAAHRVLAASYRALIPVAGLQPPLLPCSLVRPGPVGFGDDDASCTPWLLLALLCTLRRGESFKALVLPAGLQLRSLPAELEFNGSHNTRDNRKYHGGVLPHTTYYAAWPWDTKSFKDMVLPLVIPEEELLAALNELLLVTPVLIQSLAGAEAVDHDGDDQIQHLHQVAHVVEVPLPPLREMASPGSQTQGDRNLPRFADTKEQPDDDATGWADFDIQFESRDDEAVLGSGPTTPQHISATTGTQGETLDNTVTTTPTTVRHDNDDLTAVQQRLPSLRLMPSLAAGVAPGPSILQRGEMTLRGFQLGESPPAGGDTPEVEVPVPAHLMHALSELGLLGQLGTLRLVKAHGMWLPLSVHLGVPLQPPELCVAVCDQAQQEDFLDEQGLQAQMRRNAVRSQRLEKLAREYGTPCPASRGGPDADLDSSVDWPSKVLIVEGGEIRDVVCWRGL